jgi:hypothetical protein
MPNEAVVDIDHHHGQWLAAAFGAMDLTRLLVRMAAANGAVWSAMRESTPL